MSAVALTLDTAVGAQFPDAPSGTTWSDDVDVPMQVGDYARALIEFEAVGAGATTAQIDRFIEGITHDRLSLIWNSALAAQGLSTRVQVTAFREVLPRGTQLGDPKNPRLEFEMVAQVTENVAVTATILVLAFLALATTAVVIDVSTNNGKITNVTGKAIGTFFSDVLSGAAQGASRVVESALLPALIGLGVVLLIAAAVFR